MWIAYGVFITSLGTEYTEATGQSQQHVLALFSGLSYSIVVLYSVWGNLASAFIFSEYHKSADENLITNATILKELCGHHFCTGDTEGTNLKQPDQSVINILIMTLLAILAVAFLCTIFFLENTKPRHAEKSTDMGKMFRTMFSLIQDYKMLLLLPLVFHSSIQQLVLVTEYTQVSFVFF